MCRKLRSKKGFTLLEVIIVVVIIAILAAMIIPRFSITKQEAENSRDDSNIHVSRVVNAIKHFDTDRASTEPGDS